jgi:hypothetical protein
MKLYLCKVNISILFCCHVLQAKFSVISDEEDTNIIECEGIGFENNA